MPATPEADGDGCSFDLGAKATDSNPVQLARVRAVRIQGCEAIVETGVPPSSVVQAFDAESSTTSFEGPGPEDALSLGHEEQPQSTDEFVPEGGVGEPPQVGVLGSSDISGSFAAGDDAAVASIVSDTGYGRFWFEDPANIDVNSMRQELFWSYTAPTGCVKSQSSSMSLNEFGLSGWVQNEQGRRVGFTCTRAFTGGYAKFSNSPFCKALIGPFANTTRVYYNRSVVRGYQTGPITINTRYTKKGGCSSLLSPHNIVRKYG